MKNKIFLSLVFVNIFVCLSAADQDVLVPVELKPGDNVVSIVGIYDKATGVVVPARTAGNVLSVSIEDGIQRSEVLYDLYDPDSPWTKLKNECWSCCFCKAEEWKGDEEG